MAKMTDIKRQVTGICAHIERIYRDWLTAIEAGQPFELGPRVQDLLLALAGVGGDVAAYDWMLAC